MEINHTLLANLDLLGAWGIFTTDAELRIVGWNRWLENHSGKLANDLVGLNLISVYPDLVARRLDHYYRQALEGQASILSQRLHQYLLPLPPTVVNSSLAQMQQTVRISPLMEGDRVCGTLTLIEDVTERVSTEQELRQQARRLEEANRHKDEFLAMLAHELRNPLAPIRNGIRMLDIVPDDTHEAKLTRGMIERQVTHMARLIDDLLDVSRIARGKVLLQTEPCDLIPLLRQVAADVQSIVADNDLTLSVELPSEACWIECDAIRISQIVFNLLQNASKFTNRGGEVRLTAKHLIEERTVVVNVTDNGIGMSPETVGKVFDSFSQAETSLARSKGGLGLGLALVKGLTESHGGSVTAESPGVGRGSSFTLRLPTVSPPQAAATNELPQTATGRKIRRVLVVEDNRDTASSLKMLLNHSGFEVTVAFTGAEGVAAALASPPDAVLCDIGLPGLDGYAVARALRKEPDTQGAFLIAQSGYGQAEDVERARAAGFDVHLIKPVSFQELHQTLVRNGPVLRPPATVDNR